MKKIFFSVLAIAALAACTKSEVAYDDTPQEIGFTAVAGNITKAPVFASAYPEGLHMYVNAFTSGYTPATDETPAPDYFANIEFERRASNGKWGGTTRQYWPNETALHFSGYSKSGNIGGGASASYDPTEDKLTITGYNPGVRIGDGENDLMWFPKTISYTKDTGANGVVANMYHTCSWITFLVQGDATTGNSESTYKITGLTMNGVDMTANVVCTGNESLSQDTLPTYVEWSANNDKTGDNTTYTVTLPAGGVELKSTCVTTTDDNGTVSSPTPKNIETSANTTTGGNIVVIPQEPRTIDLTWSYTSPAGKPVTDSATGLSLSLGKETVTIDGNQTVVEKSWEPGKHYVYTITIGASEILIAPTPVSWVDGTAGNVTVQ